MYTISDPVVRIGLPRCEIWLLLPDRVPLGACVVTVMNTRYHIPRFCHFLFVFFLISNLVLGATTRRRRRVVHRATGVRHRTVTGRTLIQPASYTIPRPVIRGGPWTEPTYADSTTGDNVDGEDLGIRRAAVEAL